MPDHVVRDDTGLWPWVERRAQLSPDAPFAFDEHDRAISFLRFKHWSERVAAGLLAQGICTKDRVAWMLPTRIEALVLTAALRRIGCEQIPLIPMYGPREVRFIVEQSKPAWVIVPGKWRGTDYAALFSSPASAQQDAPRILVAAPDLPTADPASLPDYAPTASAENPLEETGAPWIFYTSGTTSVPKGAIHTDPTLFAAAVGLDAPHGLQPRDRLSLVFPCAHIGGPILLLSALRIGHALILCETFDPAIVIDVLSRHGVTLAGPGPAFWQAYLEAQRNAGVERLFPDLRALIGGGASKPAHLHAEARRLLGVPILSGYGLTECPSLAYNHLDDPDEVLATDGRAVAGVEIQIALPEDKLGHSPLEPGAQGEIRVRGPMLFRGYLDPEINRDTLDAAGFLRTGDLGTLDSAGQLRVTGRLKDVIIRKGENLSAKEIEEVLASHGRVADVAVIGLPDEERGELCCAVVVAAAGDSPLNLSQLVHHCAEAGLMKQKYPEQLELVDSLPRNSTGKILKTELRARFGAVP